MDGYYTHGQLQREMSHPHPQQRQQQDQPQQQQQNPQTMNTRAPGMPNQRMGPDSLGKIVNDNQSALLRRRSMPQGFASNMQNGERRMSESVGGNMTTFGDVNNGMGGYEFNLPPSAAFPSVNTNINMQDQLEHFMDYCQVSSDVMGGMIPNQLGGMNLGVRHDINQMNMFSPAGQYPHMASDYFSMDMTNSAPTSATPSVYRQPLQNDAVVPIPSPNS